MLQILLHSSKTMRPASSRNLPYQEPAFLTNATQLNDVLRNLDENAIASLMHVSPKKASETRDLIASWSNQPTGSRPAIDAFLGDIYSGLQVRDFSSADRAYANQHLLILSGLYGVLKALDSIHPYRLEMGYRLSGNTFKNLYDFWADHLAGIIQDDAVVINLSAVEYTKAILPHIKNPVITPKFLTISAKTGKPEFVTVHAKVARGAFAHWLIKHRADDVSTLQSFNEIGYSYDSTLSLPDQPVFVCDEFKGIGLSVRLT